jgi:phosphomevalonate kinase
VTPTVASAPGKIVLCGEYAVLDGAPAICAAINRRARAGVSLSVSDFHTVRTVGHIDGDWKFRVGEDGVFEWIGSEPPTGSLDLLQAAWGISDVTAGLDISLETDEFLDSASHAKLGLGSSAALTAALITVLFEVTNRVGDVVTEAMAAHRRLQQGRGSGVDIAASLSGGVIEYRMDGHGACQALRWPAGLEYAVLWSGRPASTLEKLARLEECRRSAGPDASATALLEAAEAAARSWPAGNTAELLEVFRLYIDALVEFDVDHELGIFDAGHRELAEVAGQRNLVYKPCGAGGGDTGIVLATDKQAIADFAVIAGESGFQVLDLSLEAEGARLES